MSNLLFRVSRIVAACVAFLLAVVGVYALSDSWTWPGPDGAWTVAATAILLGTAGRPRSRKFRPFVKNVLVLGKTDLACAVIAELQKRSRYRVLNIAELGGLSQTLTNGHSFLSRAGAQGDAKAQPDRIVVALLDRRGQLPIEALLEAKQKGIVIEDALHVYERLTGKLAIDRVHPSHLIYSNEFRRSAIHGTVQRVLSVVLSAAGLVLSAPLLAAIAMFVKLDSPGPMLFMQERIGKDGRRFPLVKFRTMHPVETQTSEWEKDNGSRITRVGRWLRKFRLDEVPQLFNVLLGHMNLVGPRPHPASNYALFMKHIPFYGFRSTMLPGITGWAQIRYGYANSLEEETEKMCYDLYYIKHASLWMDFRILLKTIWIVVRGNNRRISPKPGVPSQPEVGSERRLDAA